MERFRMGHYIISQYSVVLFDRTGSLLPFYNALCMLCYRRCSKVCALIHQRIPINSAGLLQWEHAYCSSRCSAAVYLYKDLIVLTLNIIIKLPFLLS